LWCSVVVHAPQAKAWNRIGFSDITGGAGPNPPPGRERGKVGLIVGIPGALAALDAAGDSPDTLFMRDVADVLLGLDLAEQNQP
jgi:hypothetical protein